MSRWNISDPDRGDGSEPRTPDPLARESGGASPSVGRAGISDPPANAVEREERVVEPGAPRARERRTQHQDRGRTYSLRSSEIEAMVDIGRFRVVDVQDLERFVYRHDTRHMKQDLESLRGQGLIEEKTVFQAHKASRKVVTLTEEGQRITRARTGLSPGQRIYHGFVKPKEINHDADLYKVYQKAIKEIEEKGGKPLRVRLDFELKESINRAKEAARRRPGEERVVLLRAVAQENGLTIQGTRIQLPDIQIEYETREGNIEKENLELLSQNYREDGIRGKAAAGFKVYARAQESNRIRRALRDTGLVREVLSV